MLLQASAFFQDFYMVDLLCQQLGSRMFKSLPEAGTSSSDQQATRQHIDQVCTAFHLSECVFYCELHVIGSVRCLARASWK